MVFSTDIIIGFPGETDADFNDTMDLVRQVNFVQSYSFKYSARPGTPATALSNLVPEKIKDERLQILQSLLVQQTKAFNERFVGKTIAVLFDKIGDRANQLHGRSVYGQPVYAEGNPRLVGQTMDIAIENRYLECVNG